MRGPRASVPNSVAFQSGSLGQCVYYARDLPRPFHEISARRLFPQRTVLPIVAGVMERGHNVAAPRQRFRQAAVVELRPAGSVTDDDQPFRVCIRGSHGGHPDRKRSHHDRARRRLRRMKNNATGMASATEAEAGTVYCRHPASVAAAWQTNCMPAVPSRPGKTAGCECSHVRRTKLHEENTSKAAEWASSTFDRPG